MSYYKECPDCGGTTHSAYEGGHWKCEDCGEDLSQQPLMLGTKNEKIEMVKAHLSRVKGELAYTMNPGAVHYLKGQEDILQELLSEMEA